MSGQALDRVADAIVEHSFDHEAGECMCGFRGAVPNELIYHVAEKVLAAVRP